MQGLFCKSGGYGRIFLEYLQIFPIKEDRIPRHIDHILKINKINK